MKPKSVFVCSECGAESPKWMGRCSSCGAWNTYTEEIVTQSSSRSSFSASSVSSKSAPLFLEEISKEEELRIDLGCEEFNRVLGGGMVIGSLVLIGGEPGIGKSTLLLQTILHLPELRVLYATGEESAKQLKMRADRLGYSKDCKCQILCETHIEEILSQVRRLNPEMLIVDSIQTLYTDRIESSPGTITQVRECTIELLKLAKENNLPVFIVGHINKEGGIAGPKVLEHIVDVVLRFEGDKQYSYRILRGLKNRFGSTNELGIYEMKQEGLAAVLNPSELLLSEEREGLSGVAVAVAMEGIRAFLIETQSLVSSAVYGTPQRGTTGFDVRRLNMLLAVLEKRVGFKIAQKDVFFNLAGGLRVNDTAIDLAVIASILSSSLDIAIDPYTCLAGEVGLSGEIRRIGRIEQRIQEVERLGFKRIFIPKDNLKGLPSSFHIEIVPVAKVEEAFKILFSGK
ncbi:MAG TPA: DNA repair protein RadA [Porphyromonadaceae bacterium]|nr:DNA repair protein RadA [Porphyromonadaceae bacterium]